MAKQLRSTVKLSKVKAVNTGHIYSIRATEELENGFVVKLGDIDKKNIEVHEMVKTTASTDKGLVLIANPAIVYDNARLGAGQERYYFMENGEVVRGYQLAENDVVGISKLGIEGTPVEGEYLVAGATTKLKHVSADPADGGFLAKIIRIEKVGGALALNLTHDATEYVMVEIIRN